MNPRRAVRVTESFFDRLDELLTADRTVAGGPSATDFLLHEMPAIIDSLALAFEASTHPVADREDLRGPGLGRRTRRLCRGVRRPRSGRRRRDHLSRDRTRVSRRVPRFDRTTNRPRNGGHPWSLTGSDSRSEPVAELGNPGIPGFSRWCRVPSHSRGHGFETSVAHSAFPLAGHRGSVTRRSAARSARPTLRRQES